MADKPPASFESGPPWAPGPSPVSGPSSAPDTRRPPWFLSLQTFLRRLGPWPAALSGPGLLLLLAGFFLGRASVFGALQPFGPAAVIALAALRRPRPALLAALGAVAGGLATMSAPGPPPLPWDPTSGPFITPGIGPVPIVGFVWLLTAVAGRYLRPAPWLTVLGAVVGTTSLRVVAAAFAGDSLPAAVAESGAELAAIVLLLPLAPLAHPLLVAPSARHLPSSPMAHPAPSVRLSPTQVGSLLVVLALIVLGARGIGWEQYALDKLLTDTFLLIAAVIGGPGLGAAAGAGGGLLTLISGAGLGWEAALLAPAGLLAGLGGRLGRTGAVAGMITVQLLLSPYADSGRQIALALTHALLAALIIVCIPRPTLHRLSTYVPGSTAWHRTRHQQTIQLQEEALAQLHEIGDVFDELSNTFTSGGQTATAAAFESRRTDSAHHRFDGFVYAVSDAVCRGCSHYEVCWEQNVYKSYRDLLGAAATSENRGPLREADLPPGLRRRCIQPAHLVAGMNTVLRDEQRDQQQRQPAPEPPRADAAPRQMSGIATIIRSVAHQLERADRGVGATGRAPSSPPKYRLEMDVLEVAGDGFDVSGDSFQRIDLPGHRVALIMSDGMGTGTRAAAQSEAAVSMLGRFLLSGFDLDFAVNTINSVLLLRGDDETFATLDVALIDLATGTVEMLKSGAAPTFIRSRRGVEAVRAVAAPVGILDRVDTPTVQRRLSSGDMLVMATDGALGSGIAGRDKINSTKNLLLQLQRPRPHDAVERLFSRVQGIPGQKLADDVTIVAVSLMPLS